MPVQREPEAQKLKPVAQELDALGAHEPEVGEPRFCSCAGNCGSQLHKANQTRGVQICSGLAVPSSPLCLRCQCEVLGCHRCRQVSFGRRRWCRGHRVDTLSKDQYWTARGGLQVLDPSWPTPLKVVARISHMLSLPSAVPADLAQFLLFFQELEIGSPGEVVDAEKFASIFWAHAIKWPPCIQAFQQSLRGVRGSLAGGFAEAFQAAILRADGQGWPNLFFSLHGSISTLDHMSGLLFTASNLGIVQTIQSVGDRARHKKKVRGQACPRGEVRVSLGRYQQHVSLTRLGSPGFADLKEISDVLQAKVQEEQLQWPKGADDVPEFADALVRVAMATRNHRAANGGMLTGGKARHAYNVKNFVRMVLIALEAKIPGLFDGIPFHRLSDWMPDQCEYTKQLPQAIDVQKVLGVSPLFLACWCCMVGWTPDAEQQVALNASEDALWAPFLQHENAQLDSSDSGRVSLPFLPHDIVRQISART